MGTTAVYVFQHNHFDPLWQRCWSRSFDYRGKRYRSYAEVQEYVIDRFLENAGRGTAFTEGQAAVIRMYLDRNPERLEEVRRLVQDGQIELLASGEIVCDTNMPSGETLLRSFVLGQRYFEDTFGVIPSIASLEDAFGHSAQLPQILRGVECVMVTDLSRRRVSGSYWRGLDGSVVFTGNLPAVRRLGHWRKISPCPACAGVGCERCGGRGLGEGVGLADEDIWRELTSDWGDAPAGALGLGGEEAVPNLRLPDMIERARTELKMELHDGLLGLLRQLFADAVARVDDPTLPVSDQVEANCVYTGCYVSRIRTKQDLRRIENLVSTAERWATVGYLLGAEYPAQSLLGAWRHTVFLAFHDAVTGTHLDQPYQELLEMQREAEGAARSTLEQAFTRIEARVTTREDRRYLILYNSDSWERSDPVTARILSRGLPSLLAPGGEAIDVLDACATGEEVAFTFRAATPPLGYVVLELVPHARPVDRGALSEGCAEVENGLYVIRVGDRGIESILDKRTGASICHPSFLVNELLLEEDRGDPWGTMVAPPPSERLGTYTRLLHVRRGSGVTEAVFAGQYRGADGGVTILSWRQTMTLYRGYDRIDFRTEIDWDSRNRRVRVALPTGLAGDEAVYSVPYGALRRSSYEPEMTIQLGTNGDWPAVNWIDLYDEGRDVGVAVLNTGTPSHRVDDGLVLLSLLRSPAELWSTAAEDYDYCLDFDGVRDAGPHVFRYCLLPHRGDFRSAGIERRGRELNNPLICRPLRGTGAAGMGAAHSFIRLEATDNVLVAALKKADRDGAIVVRLAETAGRPGRASLWAQETQESVSLVNFLERQARPVSGAIPIAPFQILTVRMEPRA